MAAKDRSRKALEDAQPYVQRLLQDAELRASLLGAYASTRNAIGRMSNGKGATHALLQDPKVQRELIQAANSLRTASNQLMGQPPRRRRRRRAARRSLMLIGIGAILAIALSSELRSKILDMLFGAEEEFDYTSTTAAPSPATAGVGGS
jgi:hypothetical protein